jgi:hypothetical protein
MAETKGEKATTATRYERLEDNRILLVVTVRQE